MGGIAVLGERIRYLRELRQLKQEQLAERVGVTKQTVSNWENGNMMPSVDAFLRVTEFFHTTPNYLLGYDDRTCIDTTGLYENEVAHLMMLIDDLKARHEK